MPQQQSKTVVKEILLDAPVHRVWKAITNKNEIKQWSFDIAEFEPVVGFKFTFYGEKEGRKFLHLCEVTEVQINRKLAYTWTYDSHPEAVTIVTITLTAEGSKTMLVLTHKGLEKLPQDTDFSRDNFVAGWEDIIGKHLKKHVEK